METESIYSLADVRIDQQAVFNKWKGFLTSNEGSDEECVSLLIRYALSEEDYLDFDAKLSLGLDAGTGEYTVFENLKVLGLDEIEKTEAGYVINKILWHQFNSHLWQMLQNHNYPNIEKDTKAIDIAIGKHLNKPENPKGEDSDKLEDYSEPYLEYCTKYVKFLDDRTQVLDFLNSVAGRQTKKFLLKYFFPEDWA